MEEPFKSGNISHHPPDDERGARIESLRELEERLEELKTPSDLVPSSLLAQERAIAVICILIIISHIMNVIIGDRFGVHRVGCR